MSDTLAALPTVEGPDGASLPPWPDEAPPTHAPSRLLSWRTLLVGTIGTFLVAMLCNGLIDLLQSGGDLHRLLTYSLDEARLIFLISSLLVWLALLGAVAVTGRLWISMGAFVALATVIGLADAKKLELRQEPIYPSDVAFAGQAGFLTEMVGTRPIVMAACFVLLVLLVFGLIGRIAARSYRPLRRRTDGRAWRRLVVLRLVTVVAVLGSFSYVAQFNEPGNKVREAYESAGSHWAFWFQKINYARNGFVGGFLYNLNVPAMEQPDGYGPDAMETIAERYSTRADQVNEGRNPGALDDVNVVVVLSEALSDPTKVEGVTLEEDPLPFTRELMSRTTSGEMLAQYFGGGTANMEFEALTGLSLSQFLPQMNTPYQMLVPETPTFPSAVGLLAGQGHEPIAVHPYMTSMYKRYEVYPTLGFSEFVHDETMQDAEHVGDNDFISDASAFDEVLHQIETSSDPTFVNLVTMQNHYPMEGKYDDPVGVDGVTGEVADQLSHYARGLRHTDDALREFIGSLEASDEKTAVVVYGDHAPAFWDGEVREQNDEAIFRRTPYFLWTNFEELPAAHETVTSPIHFLPMLFDGIGAPLPPYYALLRELQQEIPAMEQGEYHLADGRVVAEDELPTRAAQILADYRMVQYDLAVGERFSQDELFYPEAP
jgi:phosphoglycerol transferase MdoB-like AlkP superfamily enzyme